jgi:transcriptional regulator with XRE-family HTH domain
MKKEPKVICQVEKEPMKIYQKEKKLIGERLEYLRIYYGCSKAHIIKETGIRRGDLNRILRGEENVTVITIFMILGAIRTHLLNYILSPEFVSEIRTLAEEQKFVNEYNKQLHLQEDGERAE